VKRLPDATQRYLLTAIAALLMVLGTVFAIPAVNSAVIGLFWFFLKVAVFVYVLIWFRGTFPRFRYDQLMNIGWKVLIPLGMAAILVNAVVGMLR
jgi:NADH-quinone oxidoreductase subunit H